MSGLCDRRFPVNELDYEIFRKQYKESLNAHVGLSSLPLDVALEIALEVQREVMKEAKRHPTFDDYWVSI